jgi:nucleotide-binding universal stress UspA family protein
VVLGTHGRKGLEHTVFGSVAENVVRRSPVPVLTINPYTLKTTS